MGKKRSNDIIVKLWTDLIGLQEGSTTCRPYHQISIPVLKDSFKVSVHTYKLTCCTILHCVALVSCIGRVSVILECFNCVWVETRAVPSLATVALT